MPTIQLEDNLQLLVNELSNLRTATPNTHPDYSEIENRYREASNLLESSLDKAIDDADSDYLVFSERIKEAIDAIGEAKKKIDKISKAIAITAQVIDIAGKIIAKI